MEDFYCYSNRGFLKIGDDERNNIFIPIKMVEKSYWIHVNEKVSHTSYADCKLICYVSGKKINIYKDEDSNTIISSLIDGTYNILINIDSDILINKINSSIE